MILLSDVNSHLIGQRWAWTSLDRENGEHLVGARGQVSVGGRPVLPIEAAGLALGRQTARPPTVTVEVVCRRGGDDLG